MLDADEARPVLRSDARRNRRRLVDAAREVMREQGLDASLGEVARRAGLGSATLYRHFPTREALFEAVLVEHAGEYLKQVGTRVLGIEDAWEALVVWFEDTCHLFASDQAFADLVAHGMPDSPALDELRARGLALIQTLVERARRQGAVRPEIELTDVLFVVNSLLASLPPAITIAPEGWRRHLLIALEGLRPHHGAVPLPAGMTFDQLVELGDGVNAGYHRHGAGEPNACLSNTGSPVRASAVRTGVISDQLWELIEPELPPSTSGRRGRPWRDHRQTLEAILWRYQTGCAWRDVPAEFGPWQTLWKRHRRWVADGTYQRILERALRR
jgi:AcrR family transcriptional regulator